jgi:hypothetical protein
MKDETQLSSKQRPTAYACSKSASKHAVPAEIHFELSKCGGKGYVYIYINVSKDSDTMYLV